MDLRPPTTSGPQPEALVIAGENPQLGRMLPGQIHSDRAQTYTQWWSKSSELPVLSPSPVLWFLTSPLHWNSDFLLLSIVRWCSFPRTTEPPCLVPRISATKPLFTTTILFFLLQKCLSLSETHFSPCVLRTETSLHSGSDCPPKVFIRPCLSDHGATDSGFFFCFYHGSYRWWLM